MAHSIDIKRSCRDGECIYLELKLRINEIYVFYSVVCKYDRTESAAVKELIESNPNICAIVPNLQDVLSEKVNQLLQKRHNVYVNEDVIEVLPITSEQVSQLTHISCRFHCKERSKPVTRARTEEYGVPQYDLKYRLKTLDENSNAHKLFNQNKCSVCLSSYQDVLDVGHHLVVVDCCHVFCCLCLDNILKSTDQRCPLCRNYLDCYGLELMNFNIDFKVNEEVTGKVFCETFDK